MAARFLLKSVEQSQSLLVRGYGAAQNHGFQKGFFGMKVIMDRSQIDACLSNNTAQGSSSIAVFGKKPFRCIEDALFGVIHKRLNQTSDYSA